MVLHLQNRLTPAIAGTELLPYPAFSHSQLETATSKVFVSGRAAGAGPGTGGAGEPRNQHFGSEERESECFLSFTP